MEVGGLVGRREEEVGRRKEERGRRKEGGGRREEEKWKKKLNHFFIFFLK